MDHLPYKFIGWVYIGLSFWAGVKLEDKSVFAILLLIAIICWIANDYFNYKDSK